MITDSFSNVMFFCSGLLMFLGALYSMMFFIKFVINIIHNINDQLRFSSDSKDFKIGDPVVYDDHGDDFFTYINGVYSGEQKWGLCYSLEAVEFVVWSDKLRHPTKEELEKYFRK